MTLGLNQIHVDTFEVSTPDPASMAPIVSTEQVPHCEGFTARATADPGTHEPAVGAVDAAGFVRGSSLVQCLSHRKLCAPYPTWLAEIRGVRYRPQPGRCRAASIGAFPARGPSHEAHAESGRAEGFELRDQRRRQGRARGRVAVHRLYERLRDPAARVIFRERPGPVGEAAHVFGSMLLLSDGPSRFASGGETVNCWRAG